MIWLTVLFVVSLLTMFVSAGRWALAISRNWTMLTIADLASRTKPMAGKKNWMKRGHLHRARAPVHAEKRFCAAGKG